MYQIKAGLETIQGASCSVLTYNGETEVLYRADEPAGSTVRDAGCGGGTDGEKAVRFANNILAESDKAIKLLFVICDGDLRGVESYVAKMRQAGVMTVLAWVGVLTLTLRPLHTSTSKLWQVPTLRPTW